MSNIRLRGATPNGPLIAGDTMGADITSARWIELGARHLVSAEIYTVQGAGAADHVGTLKFLGGMTEDSSNAVELSIPQVTIPTGAALARTLVEFEAYFPYLWAFYDRTSGGDDDQLYVNVSVKQAL